VLANKTKVSLTKEHCGFSERAIRTALNSLWRFFQYTSAVETWGKPIHTGIVCIQDLVRLILGWGNFTFLEVKNVIPFVICQAKYIKFLGPNTWESFGSNDSSSALYQLRLFRKNSRRFPFGQYSIIMQRFEFLPIEISFVITMNPDCRQFLTIIIYFCVLVLCTQLNMIFVMLL
jgi:hypothetical protein